MSLGMFNLGAVAGFGPQLNQVAANFTVNSPAAAPTQCTGPDTATYITQTTVSTGTSTDTGEAGRFSLTGNVKIKVTEVARITGATGNIAVATGSFTLTYPSDAKHRVKGTLNAVALANLDNSASGRGFILAKYQKKTSAGWKSTGDQLLANTTFSNPAHLTGTGTTITGSIGSTVATADLGAKAIGHC